MKISLLLIAVTGIVCQAEDDVHINYSASGEPIECDEGGEQQLLDGNAAFTGKFLYEAVKSQPNKNVILSGFSVLQPVAQLALYAKGETLKQLLTTLNLRDTFNLRCVFPNVLANIKKQQDVVLKVANKIFATDAHPLSKAFLKDIKLVFDGIPESVNFTNKEAAAEKINKWVETETNNHIKNLADPGMFNELTRLVLTNAIYFMGNWMKPFNAKVTEDRHFHTSSNEVVRMPTMHKQDTFKYGESKNLDCKVLEMFYKGGEFSLVVFLPNKNDGLSEMVEKLQNHREFYEAYHNTEQREVDVYLPKIKIESDFDLVPIMTSAGMKDIFDESKSNLTDILEVYEPLYVSHARQKAFVAVDETGTEATAATLFVVAVPTSALLFSPPVPTFKADHPFAFYILNKKNIIFSGSFVTN